MLLTNVMGSKPANRIVVCTTTTRDKHFDKPIYLISCVCILYSIWNSYDRLCHFLGKLIKIYPKCDCNPDIKSDTLLIIPL